MKTINDSPTLNLDHKHLHFRRTKIIATIGPACSSPEKVETLIKKGLNVFRVNFSHGEPEEHLKLISLIRKISDKLKKPVAIIGDLCGPKIRVGKFKDGFIELKDGSTIFITTIPGSADENTIVSQYPYFVRDVSEGEKILLDDGLLELKVIKKYKDKIEAKVIHGGKLKDNKGMNLPDSKLDISALTEKDKSDVKYCVKGDVDYIALSFVRKAQDILDLKDCLKENKAEISIIAKIEKPEALANFSEIVHLADGIMIARGDLGVELPQQKVPIIQNKLIQITNRHNKPVIVATQMLESMIVNAQPTRAEVADVSGACIAGADAVMLSGETSVGKYPIETFEMMDKILRETETYQFFALNGNFKTALEKHSNPFQHALGVATAQLSRDLKVRSIFVLTKSGYTPKVISADRPAAPILTLTTSKKLVRQLCLLWGVNSFLVEEMFKFDDFIKYGEKLIKDMKLASPGDYIIMLSKLCMTTHKTNSIVVHQVS
jgi:pyruvate kinase